MNAHDGASTAHNGTRGWGPALRGLGLTRREAEVLGHRAAGLTHQEVANELGISHWTVSAHLRNAVRTLGVSPREAISIAQVVIENEDEWRSELPEHWAVLGELGLTDREAQVLACRAAGMSNAEAADVLGIASSAAASAGRTAWLRLDVDSQVDAIELASQALTKAVI